MDFVMQKVQSRRNGSMDYDFEFVDHSRKPFKGYFKEWHIIRNYRDERIIIGVFDEHPEFDGKKGHSSPICATYDADGYWDVYTENSHYKLNYNEEEPDREFWDMS